MLYTVFDTILKMNCIASVIAIVLLSVKFILQKIGCPRKIMFLLWAVIAFRLICPVSISTDISLFHIMSTFDKTNCAIVPQMMETTVNTYDIITPETVPNDSSTIQDAAESRNIFEYIKWILPYVWFAGMCVMFSVGIISYVLLKKRLRFAVKGKDNIYTSERIPTSFVLGIFKPRIFIPENLREQNLEHIIIHEKTHIRRADHITKLVAYMLLSVHWFNPLNWLLFKIFSDDMEFACDESTLSKIGFDNKKQYLNTLLVSAVNNKKTISFYHVCFSANPTKRRVENMIRLKKHSKILTASSIVICILAIVMFGTNAEQKEEHNLIAAKKSNDISERNDQTFTERYATDNPMEINDSTTQNSAHDTKADTERYDAAAVENINTQQSVQTNANTSVLKTKGIGQDKITEVDVVNNIDFEQKVFEDDTQIENIEQELNNKGITQTKDKSVKLGKNYVINEYSFASNCNDTSSNISCDDNGNISLYFDVNAESLVDVSFADSTTKEVITEFGILANPVNSYSFTGFRNDKTYDVTVQGKTQGTWKIEGEYISY